jgi:uncharacterized membrane protein
VKHGLRLLFGCLLIAAGAVLLFVGIVVTGYRHEGNGQTTGQLAMGAAMMLAALLLIFAGIVIYQGKRFANRFAKPS